MPTPVYCAGPGPHGPDVYASTDGYLMDSDVPLRDRVRCPNCFAKAENKRQEMVEAARQAFETNKAFIALDPPTSAQAMQQVDRLTLQMQGVLRLLADVLDE